MIPNLQPDTTYAVHLRAASTSGGKDWVGSVTAQGEIHTYWGRTGHISQHAARPGDISILHRIVNQKQNGKDRYQLVELFTRQHGWQSQRAEHPDPPEPTAEPPDMTPVIKLVDAPDEAIRWDF